MGFPQDRLEQLVIHFTGMFPAVHQIFDRALGDLAASGLDAPGVIVDDLTQQHIKTMRFLWQHDSKMVPEYHYIDELPERPEKPFKEIKTISVPFPWQQNAFVGIQQSWLPQMAGLRMTDLYLQLLHGLLQSTYLGKPLYGIAPEIDIEFDGIIPKLRLRLPLWGTYPQTTTPASLSR